MNQYRSEDVLTILTDPIPSLFDYYSEIIKSFVRPVLRKLDGKQPLKKIIYGGHYAVTRSLIEGLEKAGIPYVYNPRMVKQCTARVLVLAGLHTLKQALELKAVGKIKMLAAGPNLVIMPSDSPEVIGSKLIDKFVLNSEWTKSAYCAEMPHLLPYTIIWPAGVDTEYWKPDFTVKKRNKILFYVKSPERNVYEKCKVIVEERGLEVTEIIYGKYTLEQYKSLLNESILLVYFGKQESQGISLLESWALDVPTLVWNTRKFFLNGIVMVSASAPYLSEDTGMFFKNPEDFENCISQLLSVGVKFKPREWVLKNMTDEIAAIKLIQQLAVSGQIKTEFFNPLK